MSFCHLLQHILVYKLYLLLEHQMLRFFEVLLRDDQTFLDCDFPAWHGWYRNREVARLRWMLGTARLMGFVHRVGMFKAEKHGEDGEDLPKETRYCSLLKLRIYEYLWIFVHSFKFQQCKLNHVRDLEGCLFFFHRFVGHQDPVWQSWPDFLDSWYSWT